MSGRSGLVPGLVAPSNVPYTSEILSETIRELDFKRDVYLEDADEVGTVWSSIVRLFQPSSPVLPNLEGFKKVMRDEYDLEEHFNKELFLALRKCLGKLIIPIPKKKKGEKGKNRPQRKPVEDYSIIFKYGLQGQRTSPTKYAIGIARETNAEQKIDDDDRKVAASKTNMTVNNSSGVAMRAKMNHCTCLFQGEKDGTWTVVACLSAIKLEISNQSGFATLKVSDNKVDKFALKSNPGGVTQVMMYSLEWVLPSHAKLGLLDDDLCWATIIGNKGATPKDVTEPPTEPKTKKSKSAPQLRTRAVSGKLYIPEACGDRIKFAVTGYVNPEEENCTQEEAIDRAISIYLKTLFCGLDVAKRWMDSPKPVPPCTTSGKKVMIGPEELKNLTLRASATFGKFRTDYQDHEAKWKVNQGEILTGKVNIHQIENQLPRKKKDDFVAFKVDNVELDVVVKVSSLAVHGYLVHPDRSIAALKAIQAARVDLSEVLYAAYRTPTGLITIMADLSLQGYNLLKPMDGELLLSKLWKAFQDMVTTVLLPMADFEFIHPDIRPGYDVTANILCKIDRNSEQATMRLIDYESLIKTSLWRPPMSSDFKYIGWDDGWTAETFVWWQCITTAFAWIERKTQSEMVKINLKSMLSSKTDTKDTPSWLEKFRDHAAVLEMNEDHIKGPGGVLSMLGNEIHSHEIASQTFRS
jgi:hypothetical protein